MNQWRDAHFFNGLCSTLINYNKFLLFSRVSIDSIFHINDNNVVKINLIYNKKKNDFIFYKKCNLKKDGMTIKLYKINQTTRPLFYHFV